MHARAGAEKETARKSDQEKEMELGRVGVKERERGEKRRERKQETSRG